MDKKQLWIIDDDNVFQMLSKKLIQNQFEDYEVHCYMNGEEALEAFQKCVNGQRPVPDVILLDLNMPKVNGWEFLDTYEQHANIINRITLHIVSSSIDPDDIDKANSYRSVNEFIHKPLSVDSLSHVL